MNSKAIDAIIERTNSDEFLDRIRDAREPRSLSVVTTEGISHFGISDWSRHPLVETWGRHVDYPGCLYLCTHETNIDVVIADEHIVAIQF